MTILPGFNRFNSAATSEGMPVPTNSTGASFIPATGAPESASGKLAPVARYAVPTPAG